jgi:hypothetical protein
MAVLAAGASHSGVTEARNKGKDCKKKEKQRCQSDVAGCKTTILTLCDPPGSPVCIALENCCDQCSSNGFISCALVASASMESFG